MRAEKPNNITRGKDSQGAQPRRFIGFTESGTKMPKTLTSRLTEERFSDERAEQIATRSAP